MGAQIAQVLAVSGIEVSLIGDDEDALADARLRIEDGRFGMRAGVKLGKLSQHDFEQATARICYTTSLQEACVGVELIIEAVPEDLQLKCQVLEKADALTNADTIFATNSAGLSIAPLAAATNRPDRVIGWHWAQPAAVMKLAEIVVTPQTSAAVIREIEDTARRCGKNPIVINDQQDSWGFVTNRIMAVVRNEADRIVAEKIATPEQVDALIKDCFRWPLGPFEGQQQANYQ